MRILLLSFFVAFLFLQSCKVKDSCQLNHTGDICITNANAIDIDVRVNSTKVFTLAPGETKCSTQPVGTYSVSYVSVNSTHFGTYEDIGVIECEKNELTIDFYE